MLADYHLHTEFSEDSMVPMEYYVNKALELGFDEICFTDHVDYEVPTIQSANPKLYRNSYENIVKNYGDKLNIKMGMEFGMQVHTIDKFQNLFNSYPYDFILLSCHSIENLQLWNNEFQYGKTQKEYNERYYGEIYNIIKKYKDYSVLGHLDVIRRYDTSYYSLEKTKPMITDILNQVIKDGKGIEINTSSFRYRIPDLMPSVDILKLYYELGGEIVTIGSDSHSVSHFGNKIMDIHQRLAEIGFKHFYTFDKMEPIEHDLMTKSSVFQAC